MKSVLIGIILGVALLCIKELMQYLMGKRKFNRLCDNKKISNPSKKRCNFPDDGCIHTSTSKKGSCEWCELFY